MPPHHNRSQTHPNGTRHLCEPYRSPTRAEHPDLLPRPQRRRHRIFGGLTERQEHIFTWIAVVIVLLYVTGWTGAIHDALELRREIAREAKQAGVKLPPPPPRPAPTPADHLGVARRRRADCRLHHRCDARFSIPCAAQRKVYFATRTPGSPIVAGAPGGVKSVLDSGSTEVASDFVAPAQPGVYKLAVQLNQATRQIDDFSLITLVPFSEKQGGQIGLYYLGNWPFETRRNAEDAGLCETRPASSR